jgi:phospholipid/cholesterol/gamma-HCH transport system substrate-binding protein
MKRRDEVLVGIVATIALALGVMGSLYLARGGLLPGYPLYSVFPWGAGLKQGQPVMLSGVTVGYVDVVDIRRDGHLVVTMRVYKQYEVPQGTSARVVPNGFFGDMMVAMTPSDAGNASYVPGDTVPAGPPSVAIGDVVARVDSLGRDLQAITKALRTEMVDRGGLADIRKTVGNANALIVSLGEIAEAQSAELSRTQESLRRIAGAVDSAEVRATVHSLSETSANVSALATDLRTTTTRLNAVLAKLDGSDGSAGLLMNDPGMYRDVRSLLQRLDSLTTDFQKNPRKYIKLSIF